MQDASELMRAAVAGPSVTITACSSTTEYLTQTDGQAFGSDAEGLCLQVTPFNVAWWREKKYTLRKAEDGHVELHDDDEDRVL
jgi:hypothetical protein